MDIGSNSKYPSKALSNFAGHRFILDGIQCNSMEGFLQSLKFDKTPIQEEVCKLVGIGAKRRGKAKNWKVSQTLYWLGQFPNIHTYLGNNASGRTFLYLVTNGMFPVLWDLEYDFLSDQDEDLINFLERFIP